MSVLSNRDLEFFDENGYVIARQAVSREQAEETARAICAFAQKDPDDPGTWYAEPPPGPAGPDGPGVPARKGTIMIEIYHHQTLWNNRTAPRVHRAFSQIFGSEKLWVSHDRASINPPSRDPGEQENGLHWDADLEDRPVAFGVQGVLYLNDTPAKQGAFVCVPGFHRKLEDWLERLPPGSRTYEGDDPPRRIGAEAGDLIIWRTALPHSAGINRGVRPRVAQYIAMEPARDDDKEASRICKDFWRRRLTGRYALGGRYRKGREHHESPTAELTPLGRKLAGVDPWD